MTRIAIDHDADGAYAVITRPGQAAERIQITHRDAVRIMSEAAQVVLVEEGRRVRKSREKISGSLRDDDQPHFIGAQGE
ncbi:hypothetical protein V5F41_14650 [Xanthobacter autotrophicus]|uniref:hypothetical protein n=1 Tax=Xanthobacter autotrophicus TaxID=280 RepID=UPI003727F8E8